MTQKKLMGLVITKVIGEVSKFIMACKVKQDMDKIELCLRQFISYGGIVHWAVAYINLKLILHMYLLCK